MVAAMKVVAHSKVSCDNDAVHSPAINMGLKIAKYITRVVAMLELPKCIRNIL